jgi:nitroreductase
VERPVTNPWHISEVEFPRLGSPSEQFLHLIHYAVVAPSGHNTQPWLFRVIRDGVELFADRTRALPIVDPADRELTISCGAALCQLRLAIRHFGFTDVVALFPDARRAHLLACVSFGEARSSNAEEERLFHTISKRRSNRSAFEARPVPPHLVAALRSSAADEHVGFHEVVGGDHRHQVADLVAEGDRLQFSNKSFRRELAAWIRPNFSRKRDGIPGAALRMGTLMSYLAPLVIRTFDVGRRQAAEHRQLALESRLLAVLSTPMDTPGAWLATGQALTKGLLCAYADGVSVSFLNLPIEVAELRSRLRNVLGLAGYPQLLLRLGYGPEVAPTPRRQVSDVLVESRGLIRAWSRQGSP